MSLNSRDLILSHLKANPKAVGPKLGFVAMKYNIPARALAELLKVSEPTVYRWFYNGADPRQIYMTNIRRLMQVFKAAAIAGDIPLKGTYQDRMGAVRTVILKHKPKHSV